MTVINVCAWCDRELLKDNKPGKKYAPGCVPANASHGCCSECRRGVQVEIETYRAERENEKLQRVQFGTD